MLTSDQGKRITSQHIRLNYYFILPLFYLSTIFKFCSNLSNVLFLGPTAAAEQRVDEKSGESHKWKHIFKTPFLRLPWFFIKSESLLIFCPLKGGPETNFENFHEIFYGFFMVPYGWNPLHFHEPGGSSLVPPFGKQMELL